MRIRELQLAWQDIEDEHFTGLDFKVYGALRSFIPCSRLLPNLERLVCHDNMGPNAPYFIQPSLKSFTIYDLREDADSIADKVQETGSRIQELAILDDEMDFEDEEAFEDIDRMLMALDQLTSLTLMGPLSDDVLKHLSSSPRLVTLSFHLSNVDYASILPTASVAAFPALRKLKLVVKKDHKDCVVPFLSSISPPSLVDLHVEYEQTYAARLAGELHMDEDYVRSVFLTIARTPSLEHISLTIDPPHIEAKGLVTAAVLEPLRALQGLRSLRITGIQLQLSSSDNENLAWPKIETLHLCPKSSLSGGLTSKDVAALKQKYPSLREVAVKLDRAANRAERA